ncbi:hypothetical protein NHX12_009424, partial [Muraenolepis orangiensis]
MGPWSLISSSGTWVPGLSSPPLVRGSLVSHLLLWYMGPWSLISSSGTWVPGLSSPPL